MSNLVGETLQEILADRGLTARDLALQMDGDHLIIEEQHIHDIIAGRRTVSETDAEALEHALGIDKSFWLNLQHKESVYP